MKNLTKSITSILAVLFIGVMATSCAEDVTPEIDLIETISKVEVEIGGDKTETDETDPDEGDQGVR